MSMLAEPLASARQKRTDLARNWKPPRDAWRAWHVFLHAPEALEQLLAETVLPMTQPWHGRDDLDWFFLRYWENGPHIRLRIRGMDAAEFEASGERLRASASQIAATLAPPPGRFGDGMRYDGAHPDPANLAWLPPATVAEILYEPEYRRYGGRHGLRASEHLFGTSSALALAVVSKTRGEAGARQAIALRLTVAAIGAVVADRDEFAGFMRIMAANWEGFAGDPVAAETEALRAFERRRPELAAIVERTLCGEGGALSPPIVATWRRAVDEHVDELHELAELGLLIDPGTGVPVADAGAARRAVQNILFSHVHMMNNRLGILPQQEFQFATVLLNMVAS